MNRGALRVLVIIRTLVLLPSPMSTGERVSFGGTMVSWQITMR